MPEAVLRLEETFRRIQRERMQGVPVLNPRLRVEAVGFRPLIRSGRKHGVSPAGAVVSSRTAERDLLGVLITPWFMNLVLLPGGEQERPALAVGSEVRHRFPVGECTFLVGYESRIGSFQSCSLFSPVLEFEDQETAVATAKAVLESLFPEPDSAADATGAREESLPSPKRRELLRRMIPRRLEKSG